MGAAGSVALLMLLTLLRLLLMMLSASPSLVLLLPPPPRLLRPPIEALGPILKRAPLTPALPAVPLPVPLPKLLLPLPRPATRALAQASHPRLPCAPSSAVQLRAASLAQAAGGLTRASLALGASLLAVA